MMRAAVLLFDHVEVLDFAGPFEVLSCAEDEKGAPLFDCRLLAAEPWVNCRGGLLVQSQGDLAEALECGLVVAPGGPGARTAHGQPAVQEACRDAAKAGAVVASVCTGSFLLARAGLLDGKTATTHAFRLKEFGERFPLVKAVDQKVVDQGDILTAGGVASGIDLCLHLLERFFGPEARKREARRLQGPWR